MASASKPHNEPEWPLRRYAYALTNGVLGIQHGETPGVMLYLLPLGVGVTKGNSSRGWGTPFHSFW